LWPRLAEQSDPSLRQHFCGALHWQANHVGHRSCNSGDDISTRTLRGIGARLIEWIHRLEVPGDSALTELAKTDLRNFGESSSSLRAEHANGSADIVRSSAQPPQNHSRMT
jgi:hypothetical protein